VPAAPTGAQQKGLHFERNVHFNTHPADEIGVFDQTTKAAEIVPEANLGNLGVCHFDAA
jgi:hypothetical protein